MTRLYTMMLPQGRSAINTHCFVTLKFLVLVLIAAFIGGPVNHGISANLLFTESESFRELHVTYSLTCFRVSWHVGLRFSQIFLVDLHIRPSRWIMRLHPY